MRAAQLLFMAIATLFGGLITLAVGGTEQLQVIISQFVEISDPTAAAHAFLVALTVVGPVVFIVAALYVGYAEIGRAADRRTTGVPYDSVDER
jgi:uncharacterized paraquat-inducible protein A